MAAIRYFLISIVLAFGLSGCGYKIVKEPAQKSAPKQSIQLPATPPLGKELQVTPSVPAPVAKPAPVPQVAQATERVCRQVTQVVRHEDIVFMSLGCGNLTPRPEDTRKGGYRIASGYPFVDCPSDSASAFLGSYNGPERCRPRVSKTEYGRLLEVMGLPVAPNAEGFQKFLASPDVRVVDCSPELLSKVNMARTNASGSAFDFGHTRRVCYKYGDKPEKLLVYRKPITKTEEVCEVKPVPVAKPAPAPAPAVAPKPQVSATPNACPATDRTFRIRVWNEALPQVQACLAQSDPHWDSRNAFSRNQCIVALVKGERATGQVRPWHVQSPVTARLSVINDEGRELERLRDVELANGYAEVREPYSRVAGRRLRVEFVSAPGEFISPVSSTLGLREVRIAPIEFERPTCAYDISGAVRPSGSQTPAVSTRPTSPSRSAPAEQAPARKPRAAPSSGGVIVI